MPRSLQHHIGIGQIRIPRRKHLHRAGLELGDFSLRVEGVSIKIDPLHLSRQRRDLSLDDVPDNFNVQSKIFVSDHVPQGNSLAPGDFGMLFPETLWRLAGRLANDFYAADDRQEGAAVIL